MELFYRDDRDENFFRVCEKIREEQVAKGRRMSITDIAKLGVKQEADSFYITSGFCAKVINKQNTPTKNEVKLALYDEIIKRYNVLREEYPDVPVAEIARMIVHQKAPRFYLSDTRAVTLYYDLLKNKPKLMLN